MTEEKEAWVWLNMQPGAGPSRLKKNVSRFRSAAQFLDASPSAARWRGEARAELERAARSGVQILTSAEPGYPEPLRHLEDAPPVLYVDGSYGPEDAAAVALVGSRRPSSYGRMVASEFSRALAGWGIVTVSGLAEGIDACVHERTLDSGGRTLAVIGSGLGRLYPRENAALARRIRAQGAVISEFPMDCPPYRTNFPRRNRIISGLSLGAVVVEAADRSGALITARLAADQGKDVFAVPGMVNSPLSQGTHRLIQQGAKLACSARDVVEEIASLKDLVARLPSPCIGKGEALPCSEAKWGRVGGEGLSDLEQSLLLKLGHEPVRVDFLVEALGRKPQELAASLLVLEMKGFVQAAPGNAYVRTAV